MTDDVEELSEVVAINMQLIKALNDNQETILKALELITKTAESNNKRLIELEKERVDGPGKET